MLQSIDLSTSIDKESYRPEKEELFTKLVVLQQRARNAGLPIVVVFEGWDAAGKGSRISDVTSELDPRSMRVYSIEKPIGYEARLPFMQRFWDKLGADGTITILDRSWYARAIDILAETDARKKAKLRAKEFGQALDRKGRPYGDVAKDEDKALMSSIAAFEQQLSAAGYLVVKFFLHISKEEQKRRLDELAYSKTQSWRVTKRDYRHNESYEHRYEVLDAFLERTDFDFAPWHVVPATDWRAANLQIMRTLASTIEAALERHEQAGDAGEEAQHDSEDLQAHIDAQVSRFPLVHVPSLDDVSYDNVLPYEAYRSQLKAEQKKLRKYQDILHVQEIPLMIAYEGWDAAGKGGNIKRVARALDARGYRIVPSAAPTWDELHRPFLWRYWTNLPRTGHTAFYDRTWYGRVLVERVEGFATDDEVLRAYDEINEFEWDLQQWGAILLKFWIDVSPDEQLRRFEDRMANPDKQWKITDEDWRNREKYPAYKQAIEDMLRLTSTEYAPWQIVESDDKRFARIKALKAINEAIAQRLGM